MLGQYKRNKWQNAKLNAMEYDAEFWNNYAQENDSKQNYEFSKFIKDLAVSLNCNSILEVGCCTGNDLVAFPPNFEVYGMDLNEYAISRAIEKFPSFNFKIGDAVKLPYEENSIDLVFTHKVLNYLDNGILKNAMNEMYRVAKKYIVNCELYVGKSHGNLNEEKEDHAEDWMDDSKMSKYRNIYERWLDYKVKIVSNVEMHPEIEPQKARFVLVRKLQT